MLLRNIELLHLFMKKYHKLFYTPKNVLNCRIRILDIQIQIVIQFGTTEFINTSLNPKNTPTSSHVHNMEF